MASRKRKLNDTDDINTNVFRRFFQNSGRNQSSSTGRNKNTVLVV